MGHRPVFRTATWEEVLEYGAKLPHGLKRPIGGGAPGFSVDQANLGTKVDTGSNVTSFTITTSAAAASGALIIIGFGIFTNGALTNWSASGGGLTWTVSVGQLIAGDVVGLAWALAPAGLTSGTVVTLSMTGNSASSGCAVAMSFLGSATSSPQDGSSSKPYAAITSGIWTGNSVSITGSSDLVIAAAWGDGQQSTTASNAASGGFTGGPLASQIGAVGGVITLVYKMNVAASGIPGGTWGAGQPTGTAVATAAFLAADGGPAGPTFQPHRMPLGV